MEEYILQHLEITQITPTRNGIFVFARYPEWSSGYHFFIEQDGRVRGETTSGHLWTELSEELGGFIQAKVQSAIIERGVSVQH